MNIKTDWSVGDVVLDDLTGKPAKIIGISFSSGYTQGNLLRNSCDCVGYWLDDISVVSGGRHPWELSQYYFER